ncbi:MAG: glycosyltransferase [Saccharofermentans sp.]|nr:glycosyltransferase [Saccharofermentans sp.]
MSSDKKKILAIVTWYPSKENPWAGSFFKEQCDLLSSKYDITLLKINSFNTLGIKYLLKRLSGKDIAFSDMGLSNSFTEKEVNIFRPSELALQNNLLSRYNIRKKGIAGVGIVDCEAEKSFWRKHMARLARILDNKYDLVYGMSAQGTAVYTKLIAEYMGVPYILSEHSPFLIPGSSMSDTFKTAMEDASSFLAISNDKVRQILMQNIKLKRIVYIGNIIDEEKFKYEPLTHDEKTFLIVASHSFYKNYDLFIKAMNRLTEIADKPFKVIIAGFGANKGYSQDVDEFVKKIENSKFYDRSEMIPSVSRDDIAALYNRADAFVMTSIQEGQPVAAIEATACGLPVFSTRCGGVEDYLDEKMGRVVSILDYDALANSMNDFLNGDISYDSEYIRNTVISKFGRKAFCETFDNVFSSVVGK